MKALMRWTPPSQPAFWMAMLMGDLSARAASENCGELAGQDTPENLADRERHGDRGVLGLCRGNGDGLAAGIEGGAEDEDGRDTAETIDNREDKVGDEASELNKREPELSLSEGLDAEQLEAEEEEPEEQEVAPERDLVAPEVEDGADGIVLVGQHRSPNDEVVPADCGAKSAVDKAVREFGECATTGIQCRHLSQGLHDAERDETDDAKANQQRRRASLMQRTPRA
ncbi:hypothetical protein O988_09536, partial [Pseudogymnoascus sp. VKM F-3808]